MKPRATSYQPIPVRRCDSCGASVSVLDIYRARLKINGREQEYNFCGYCQQRSLDNDYSDND